MTITSDWPTEVRPGESITFNCSAVGLPRPVLDWLINDEPVLFDDTVTVEDLTPLGSMKSTFSSMTINKAVKSGSIMCIASNNVGEDEEEVQLKVLGPGTPPPVQVSPEKDYLKVRWSEPEVTNGPIAVRLCLC